jgi:hypothetical protein|tara:strand:+ start:173 stop:550 length:378 start_codon:yes stop_codon:yes gene_type:complete
LTYKPGWGKAFFDTHMEYISKNDMEGMVKDTYSPDAALYNAFPFLDTPPPNIIRGTDELIKAFKGYLEYQGDIQVDKLYNFLDSEEVISFQAVITSSKTGQWAVSDTWLMKNEMIFRHFGTAHKL